jgi:succinate dehydrogenase/fumarate reductase flavoprotein subunit
MTQRRDSMECDLLVLGSGMAGSTAAGVGADAGARVVLIEKAKETGGSGGMSGGYVWTCNSFDHLRFHDDGDPRLQSVILEEYPHVMAWMRRRGVEMQPPQGVLFGRGQQIDILGHLRSCALSVEKAGGHVVRGTETRELIREGGHVVGALTRHADGEMEVRTKAVLLATGGFQGSPDLRAQFIHPQARDIILRSNAASNGDGLRLALAAGAANAGPNPGFYGHLLPYPVQVSTAADFVNHTQYHSTHGLLLNRAGKRFVDESRADHTSTQRTVREERGRALLFWDARVQQDVALQTPVVGAPPMNRFDMAQKAGSNAVLLQNIAEVADVASRWGYDGAECVRSIEAFNHGVRVAPEAFDVPRVENYAALDRAPFHLVEVQPGITFSYAGLAVDQGARVLDHDGAPLPGLFAAGADVGNVYRHGYAGGLSLAATFAFRAMRTLGYVS